MASKQLVVVAGMHRSGTSLTMQALGALGLSSGEDLLAGNEFNQRGYWEATEVVAVHNDLLTALDRRWGSFQHLLPLPDDWQETAAAGRARRSLADILTARLAKAAPLPGIAIKDPRVSLVLPMWYQVASELGVDLKLIICLRNSWDVVQSLMRRDSILPEAGRLLWLSYTASALAHADRDASMLSFFEDWQTAPDDAQARLARFVGVKAASATSVYEPTLATLTPQSGDAVVDRWHAMLQRSRASGKISRRLQQLANQHLQMARHFKIWPDVLGDAALQRELSTVLVRELAVLREDRDHQVARSEELLAAYQSESGRVAELLAVQNDLVEERARQLARAQELLAAYETEAARAQELLAAYETEAARAKELLTAYETEAARSQEFRVAYKTEAARIADLLTMQAELVAERDAHAARAQELARRLERLNPLNWLKPAK